MTEKDGIVTVLNLLMVNENRFTLGLFDPLDPEQPPLQTFGIYREEDRLFMAYIIEKFNQLDTTTHALRVFPLKKEESP